jgi:aryl-alcohol dehydrogenase-like predicted oxidoreductase
MVRLLQRAFDLGINVFDTSPDYGGGRSERLIGEALRELPRDQVVVSTKLPLAAAPPGTPVTPARPEALAPAVEASLRRLRTDYLDVLLTAVADVPEHFDTVVDELLPVLDRLSRQGKVRFLGSSEQTRSDGAHRWLQHLLPADLADVVMVGHNLINQSAQRSLFPACRRQDVGVLNIFTVRRVFRSEERVRQVIDELRRDGLVDAPLPADDPLGWLTADGDCRSLVEAAYRYAAYTPGVTTVMCGTVDERKLTESARVIERGPLAAAYIERLARTFGRVAEPVGD